MRITKQLLQHEMKDTILTPVITTGNHFDEGNASTTRDSKVYVLIAENEREV